MPRAPHLRELEQVRVVRGQAPMSSAAASLCEADAESVAGCGRGAASSGSVRKRSPTSPACTGPSWGTGRMRPAQLPLHNILKLAAALQLDPGELVHGIAAPPGRSGVHKHTGQLAATPWGPLMMVAVMNVRRTPECKWRISRFTAAGWAAGVRSVCEELAARCWSVLGLPEVMGKVSLLPLFWSIRLV